MPEATTIRLLNRAACLIRDSLPRYLQACPPVAVRGDGSARGALRSAADDYGHHLAVIEELIEENGGIVLPSTFPIGFTAYNDLAMSYLVDRLVEAAQRDHVALDSMARQLPFGTIEQARVEEAAGAIQAQIDTWRAMQRRRS